eukprot:2381417-Prymnesium_polylepis.1
MDRPWCWDVGQLTGRGSVAGPGAVRRPRGWTLAGSFSGEGDTTLKVRVGRGGGVAVSYTHLRAHETLMNL